MVESFFRSLESGNESLEKYRQELEKQKPRQIWPHMFSYELNRLRVASSPPSQDWIAFPLSLLKKLVSGR